MPDVADADRVLPDPTAPERRVVVHGPAGQLWRVDREEADPEHRFAHVRLAAAWFGNLPAGSSADSTPETALSAPPHVLHLGVIPRDLMRVIRLARAVMDSAEVEGDGWNAWGEAVGSDANDESALHVTATISGPQENVAEVTAQLVDQLHRQGVLVVSSEGLETVAVLTSDADYNVDESGGVVWAQVNGALRQRSVNPHTRAGFSDFNRGVLDHALLQPPPPSVNGFDL